ncbi:hypothetical protein HMPREF9104_02587 [Lentilactobacillus kisonensis F0435]|uniref:Uncharacterized protein n=1 Tax=Lentilactobacillus kisonensis F0435 TaxID=797516 RepID=H1LIZ5_9LACO|nr:hypothetical protein HMPREF9104_02587 [Lentilactobacillus kisonensis F0435]
MLPVVVEVQSLGATVNSLIISWLPLFILPVLGGLKLAASTFADTDYLIPGILLGNLGGFGKIALIVGILGFLACVLILSAILTQRAKSTKANQD